MISGMMILPNGVDIEKFNQINKEEARNYVKTRFKIDLNAELKLIFVGRIAKEKGLIYLIDALKFLDDVELLVVGGDRKRLT
jgi:glycosyltransferase involved in cell wall biosynthesis